MPAGSTPAQSQRAIGIIRVEQSFLEVPGNINREISVTEGHDMRGQLDRCDLSNRAFARAVVDGFCIGVDPHMFASANIFMRWFGHAVPGNYFGQKPEHDTDQDGNPYREADTHTVRGATQQE